MKLHSLLFYIASVITHAWISGLINQLKKQTAELSWTIKLLLYWMTFGKATRLKKLNKRSNKYKKVHLPRLSVCQINPQYVRTDVQLKVNKRDTFFRSVQREIRVCSLPVRHSLGFCLQHSQTFYVLLNFSGSLPLTLWRHPVFILRATNRIGSHLFIWSSNMKHYTFEKRKTF